MSQKEIPAVYMRGGTSRALVFHQSDLPADRADWDAVFLAAMGSPDPSGRQLDGMGGGVSSLSKVCVVGPPTHADADVDYTFAQVGVRSAAVDYTGNCGNMASAIGPYAIDEGLVSAPPGDMAAVRIHNTNTGKIIVASFPLAEGRAAVDGDLEIDGVPGRGAPIRLAFQDPGGAVTGRLLPTGRVRDALRVPELGDIEATLIDAANPCVFVAAATLGLTGIESPAQLGAEPALLQRLEAIRCAASVAMGIAPDLDSAGAIEPVPKVAMVAPPTPYRTLSGQCVGVAEIDLVCRMISSGQPHGAIPVTGALALGVACRVGGSVAQQQLRRALGGRVTIGHASGTLQVDAELAPGADGQMPHARSASLHRTARRLFQGRVLYREVWPN